MFNGDGTVYGRFGSWLHQKDPLNKTTASFRQALEQQEQAEPKRLRGAPRRLRLNRPRA
jgi:hypothetical protein